MANLGTISTRISGRLKDPTNVAISTAEIASVVNLAIKFYAKERFWFNEFEESVTLAVDNPVVALPLDTVTPDRIFKTNGMVINYASSRWRLTKVSPAEYDAMNCQGKGTPGYWTFRNKGYEVYPYPDQAYTLVARGIKTYGDLVAADDTNDFVDNAEDLIVYETLARLFAEFRQDDKLEAYYSARAKNEYDSHKLKTRRLNTSGRIQIEEM